MRSIEEVVAAKLAAQRGGDEALELWHPLWAAYEQGGAEAVEALLARLLEAPGAAGAAAAPRERRGEEAA